MFGRRKQYRLAQQARRLEHQLSWLTMFNVLVEELNREPTLQEMILARSIWLDLDELETTDA